MLRPLDNPVLFATRVLGMQVHEGQASFLLDAHPLRVLIGGRRAGKSQALAILIAWLAVVKAVQCMPFKILVTAPTLDQARVLLSYVRKLLSSPLLEKLVTREVESPFPEVQLGETVTLMARSLADHGRHVRGHGRDLGLVALDEGFLVSEETIKEVLSPLLADTGGSMVIASTATSGVGSYLHSLYERGKEGTDARVKSFLLRTLDNPFIDQDFVRSQKQEISQEQWRVEWEGEFSSAANSVFTWNDISACAGVDIESNNDRRGRFTIGFDPAKLRDRSAVIVLESLAIPRQVVHLEDLHGRDYTRQVEAVTTLSRRYFNAKVVVDATGAGQVVTDLLRASGVCIVEPIVFTATRKAELVTSLAIALEKREIRFPADRRLLDELRFFEARRMPNRAIKYEATGQGHDDFVSALALAWAGAGGVMKDQSFAALNMPPFLRSSDVLMTDATGWARVISFEDGFPQAAWSDWPGF
ncbi:MAG: hypothetical protein FWD69_10345 [Polyangiaceae bacterium]|nr:hypothetical protein [Polyangiaceae bacterium]